MSTYFLVAPTKENIEQFCLLLIACLLTSTDYGRPMKPFFNDILIFWTWADKLGWWILEHLRYFDQTISTILALWVPCPWENGFGCFSNKKLWFSGLTVNTIRICIPNMILAVKNLLKSHHMSVVGAYFLARSFILHQAFHPSSPIHRLHSL